MKKNTKKTNLKLNKNPGTNLKTSIKHVTKQKIKKARPIHKKLALHPVSVLFMLCLGVILLISTYKATADSFSVTATVPNPSGPTSPATISNPINGQHFQSQVIDVSGVCPTSAYTSVFVSLYTNNVLVGSSSCSLGNTYQITTTLYPGLNNLKSIAYDLYDTPAPVMADITVYYDKPVVPPPPSANTVVVAPQVVRILQVDNGTPYVSISTIETVSQIPTFTGTAPPFSQVTITVHSVPVTCTTHADSQGFWTCTFNQPLDLGLHHVYISASSNIVGKSLTLNPFQIVVVRKSTPSLPVVASPSFTITSDFNHKSVYSVGQQIPFTFNPSGGVAPYAFSVDWGDGTNSVVTRITNGPFTLDHTYGSTNAALENETIKIEGIDSKGDISSLQVYAPVKNPNYKSAIASITQKTGISSDFKGLKTWLLIIWPAYFIISLMIFTFWLGERQELFKLINRKSKNKIVSHKR